MSKKSEYHIRLENENNNFISSLKHETNSSINIIINTIISNYMRQHTHTNSIASIYNKNNTKEVKEIRLKLSIDEYEFLKRSADMNGHNSVTKEAKFRLLNTLHNEKFYTAKETQLFIKLRTEINILGRNINQLLRYIQSKNILRIDTQNISKTMNTIYKKIDDLAKELEEIILRTNGRI